MSRLMLPGSPPLEITLQRSAQAKRMSLRVSRLDGRVTLTLPRWAPEAQAMAFAQEKQIWLRAALAEHVPPRRVAAGAIVPFEGRPLLITLATVRAPRVEAERLLVPDDEARLPGRVAAFLKLAARQRLQRACSRHAEALGRPFARLVLRDTRSRWGSCTAQGSLMFSWRLIMAPGAVLDYVAAHEVAHLAEMNHSAAFWSVVADLCPHYATHRSWLRRYGGELHALQFTD